MSHFARLAASVFVLAVACSSSKPPEGQGSEAPVGSAEPSTTAPSATAPVEPAAAPAPEASEAPTIATLFVRDTLADCQAEGARKCLMVRGSEDEQWRNFFGAIEGFEHDPAYAYELRVEVTHVSNPPPDAPSIHYKLVDVVSKKKAGP